MVQAVKALRDITFDEPGCAVPRAVDLAQRGVAPVAWSESVRVWRELRLVVGLQNHPDNLLKQLVCPRRNAQGASLPIGFGNIDPPNRRPSVTLMTHIVNESVDFRQRHSVHGVSRYATRERTVVTVE